MAPAVQPGQGDSATCSSELFHTAVSHSIFSPSISSTAERISAILQQEEVGDRKWPPLFIQLNELFSTASGLAWRETARWIKFEEKVEDGGERWSTPHVPVLHLHSLFELRTCLQEGTVLLDLDAHSFKEIIEKVLSAQPDVWDPELQDCLATLLLCQPLHRTTTAPLRVLTELSLSPCRGTPGNTAGAGKAKSCPEPRTQFSETPLKEQLRNQFKKKLLPGAEVASVMVGEVDFLKKPFPVFLRLREAVTLGSLAEVALPSRFLFILLGPQAKVKAYHEIGRAMATLLTDELFQRIAWQAKHQQDLIAGIDEFLDELTVLPPGKWDLSDRIPPTRCLSSPNKRISMHLREWKSHCNGNTTAAKDRLSLAHLHTSEELERTGRLFGGLIRDIRRKAHWYRSDFSDAMHIQCLSAVLYIYLATVTNAITFGGMLGDATANMQVRQGCLGSATWSSLLMLCSRTLQGILHSTGPVLVFERLLFSFSEDYGLDYLEFRLWIGLWVAFFGLVLVATEASHLVQYFTRFTEEGFCALISLIFIYDSLKKMLSLAEAFPINWHYRADDVTLYSCTCNLSVPGNNTLYPPPTALQQVQTLLLGGDTEHQAAHTGPLPPAVWAALSRAQCLGRGGHLLGNSCPYVPDIALLSFLLFGGTFLCCTTLKHFKSSRYFPTGFRKLVSDFSIILAILIFCAIDAALGLETPKLLVPSELKPTNPMRGWIVFPFGANPWWICLAAVVPAILVTILIFMDQQITAVILNRKEYKLQKGAGFHLDFLCVSLLMIVTSVMGLPWYVSATVISLAHMESLRKESTASAPGEQPEFLGIREQRLTGLVVFILTGVSVFMAPILKYIPMPVLYGVFLHMGVAALNSIQFMDRVRLLLMPAKHQPDHLYLRHVPLRRVHLFTFIQLLCLAMLWVIKSTMAAIVFPVMLLALVGIRKALECIFSLHDLSWLDNIMPAAARKEADGKLHRKQEKQESNADEDVGDILGAVLFCSYPRGLCGAGAAPGQGMQLRQQCLPAQRCKNSQQPQHKVPNPDGMAPELRCFHLGSGCGSGDSSGAGRLGHGLRSARAVV
uniref:Anion exchange protein n=1 Tax=Meleagris gallopavo TaxID=9103 RepID=G1MR17_MELGA